MGEASRTAIGVLLQRAMPLDPGDPGALDEAALRLVAGHVLARSAERGPEAGALRPHVRLRSRFAEDELQRAVARGVRQYVIVGAGFDTFGYRQPDWAAPITIFEVDHAASQAAKQAALRYGSVEVPANVRFVAADLERDDLGAALVGAGFDPTAPAFFGCLGVLVYLTRAAGDRIFAYVGGRPVGSAIGFTFVEPGVAPELAARVEALGEPFRTFDAAEELPTRLAAFGFRSVRIPTPDELAERYGAIFQPGRPFLALACTG